MTTTTIDLEQAIRHTCRSCGAPMVWARFFRSRSKVPIDPTPVDDGNLRIVAIVAGEPQIDLVSRSEERGLFDTPAERPLRYVTHFSTCPNAAEHRR